MQGAEPAGERCEHVSRRDEGARGPCTCAVEIDRGADILLTDEPFGAEEALRIGLINEVVPHARLMERAEEVARHICTLPPAAVRMMSFGSEKFPPIRRRQMAKKAGPHSTKSASQISMAIYAVMGRHGRNPARTAPNSWKTCIARAISEGRPKRIVLHDVHPNVS